MKNIDIIKLGAKIELARRSLWHFCKLMYPNFYKDSRPHLKLMCDKLQDFYTNDSDVLVINLPPRHGKSFTTSNFVAWIYGQDYHNAVMTGAYGESLSTQFSKAVRDTIAEEKNELMKAVFSDIFPQTKIKRGDSAMNKWTLEGGHTSYLATSPGGVATGIGCNILIIDDLVKNREEAYNEINLEKQWLWYSQTMAQRLEVDGRPTSRRKRIIVMTRWATNDLAGRALEKHKADGMKVDTLILKAVQDDGSMLCPEILDAEAYELVKKTVGVEMAEANYNQTPMDIKGRLYSGFKTYTNLPKDENGHILFESIRSYVDTADTGDDNLCSIVYGVYNKQAYVLDIIHTDEPQEITEPLLANQLIDYEVNVARIESNNGGRAFARAVKRIMYKEMNNNNTVVKTFHQSKNKQARILSNAPFVMENILFPVNWLDRFPSFANEILKYQRKGKNAHDDGADTLTGVAEDIQSKDLFSFN